MCRLRIGGEQIASYPSHPDISQILKRGDPEVVAEPLLQAEDVYSMENPAVGSGGRHGHSTTRANRYDALACVEEPLSDAVTAQLSGRHGVIGPGRCRT